MANVITWSLERNQHVQISLCAQHSETHGGLSQVQHGLHTGVCEDCLAERSRPRTAQRSCRTPERGSAARHAIFRRSSAKKA